MSYKSEKPVLWGLEDRGGNCHSQKKRSHVLLLKIYYLQKGGRDTIFNIFGKNSVPRNSKPSAIAFVDYEHWYISMYRMYSRKPDIRQWRSAVSELYDVHDILFFGDFSNPSLRAEISKIREVSSSIIETQNASSYHKKDYTDFIMLDHIYQRAITYGDNTDVFIIFSGDGHFSSAASFLVNRCGKTVDVYGIRDCLSTQLKNTASVTVEWPPVNSDSDSESFTNVEDREDGRNGNIQSVYAAEHNGLQHNGLHSRSSVTNIVTKINGGLMRNGESKTDREFKTNGEPNANRKSKVNEKLEAGREFKAIGKPEVLRESKANSKPDANRKSKVNEKLEADREFKAIGKPEVLRESKANSKLDANRKSKANEKLEAGRESKANIESNADRESKLNGEHSVISKSKADKKSKANSGSEENDKSKVNIVYESNHKAKVTGESESNCKPNANEISESGVYGSLAGKNKSAAQAADGKREDDVRVLKPTVKVKDSKVSAVFRQKETVDGNNSAALDIAPNNDNKIITETSGHRFKNKLALDNKNSKSDTEAEKLKDKSGKENNQKENNPREDNRKENSVLNTRIKAENAPRILRADENDKEKKAELKQERGSAAESDDIFIAYYKDILTNIRFLERKNTGKMQMKYTFGGTVDSVSEYYGVDRDMVSIALDRLCDRGYIKTAGGMLKNSKTFTVNWDKAVKDKLV